MQAGRFQIDFDRKFGTDHELTAIAGFEVRENNGLSSSYRLYGYNPETANDANQSVNYTIDHPHFYGTGRGRIATGIQNRGVVDHNRSYYANASYSYKGRYTVSASGRRDESNIFGVRANQKGVPLWSSGFSWGINNESFYDLEWLPTLKLRATYGYNGNMDNTTTAYLTSSSGGSNFFNMPYLMLRNPPNPSLSWEKVGVINLGVDFGLKNNLISGSIEYYQRNSTNLIANTPVAPQTGFAEFKGNAANMETQGVDVIFNIRPIQKSIQWDATLLFNYAEDRITKYLVAQSSNRNIVTSNYINPLEGYPYYAMFSFPTAGLNETGIPQGYLNDEISTNYAGIMGSSDPSSLIYHGSGTPLLFGSLMNSFRYKNASFSFNVLYKFGHYFRRRSIDYTALFNGSFQQGDFENRWQLPGDELRTDVPAMIYPANANRNIFYTNSESLVERADHIRLQDVRISYQLDRNVLSALPVRSLQLYLYANNLGILWRANGRYIDPDSPFFMPTPRSIAFGIQINL